MTVLSDNAVDLCGPLCSSLALADVAPADIAQAYAPTCVADAPTTPATSPVFTMRAAMNRSGGVRQYLVGIGITGIVQEAVRRRLEP
jgi:hypothetical protein